GRGVGAPPVVEAVIAAARRRGVPVLVDPKGAEYGRYRGASLITPNRKEAEEALGRRISGFDELPGAARDLIAAAGLDAAVITLGPDGIYFQAARAEGPRRRVAAVARAGFDGTRAGGTVVAH